MSKQEVFRELPIRSKRQVERVPALMFTGPVGLVELRFYWLKAILGNFYWPGARINVDWNINNNRGVTLHQIFCKTKDS